MRSRVFVFTILIIQCITFFLCGCGETQLKLKEKVYLYDLPLFNINVNGAEIPDRSDPNYKDYAECEFIYTYGKNIVEDCECKVRIRGTSSRYFPKKGYKIKLSSKISLAGLPKQKKYNLLASYMDPTMLRDYLALSISYTMNTESNRYAPRPILTELILDKENLGLYILTDDISTDIGKIPLENYVETDVEIPFLLEMDTIAFKEGILGKDYFALGTTDMFDYDKTDDLNGTALLYKLDTPEDITTEQFNYIQTYITSCRGALVNKDINSFLKLVDINAFIDYFLLGELFRNTDMAGRSVYMYRPSVNGKLIFGPSWDFDYSCSRPWSATSPNSDYSLTNAKDRFTNYDWWKLFLEIPQAEQLIKYRYKNYLRKVFVHEIEEAKEFYLFYESKIKTNAEKWYRQNTNDTDKLVEDNYNWTFDYFRLRMEMMDELFL